MPEGAPSKTIAPGSGPAILNAGAEPRKSRFYGYLQGEQPSVMLVPREVLMSQDFADIPLPKAWPKRARSAIIHVVSLAHSAIVCARGWAVNSPIARVRLRGQLEVARAEIALLTEELRIKDARMASIDSRKRPHYRPTERLAILELRAARGWSMAQTARALLVQPATIASWWKRIDEEGDSPLLQTPEPVNKYPAFVRHIVCRLKVLQPTMGKKRIAEVLARAGLHIGATTVKRMLEWGRAHPPTGLGDKTPVATADQALAGAAAPAPAVAERRPNRPVKSTRPDHVWEVDLTLVPTSAGFWVPWLPFTLPQRWPYAERGVLDRPLLAAHRGLRRLHPAAHVR